MFLQVLVWAPGDNLQGLFEYLPDLESSHAPRYYILINTQYPRPGRASKEILQIIAITAETLAIFTEP